jgi:hypothetical protein
MNDFIEVNGVEYQMVVRACENCTDGGEIMEVLTEVAGKEIRMPGTCDCATNQQRLIDFDAAAAQELEREEAAEE